MGSITRLRTCLSMAIPLNYEWICQIPSPFIAQLGQIQSSVNSWKGIATCEALKRRQQKAAKLVHELKALKLALSL